MNNKKSSPLIIFLASLLWAADSPFRKPLLVGGLTAPFIALLEHFFNTLASLPALIKERAAFKSLTLKHWAGLLYIGAGASALAAILYVEGAVAMNYNFTVAALLQKLQPIFAILLAVVFLKEKVSAKFWLLAVPALLGAYLVTFGLTSPSALLAAYGDLPFKGPALAVLAALLWAGGTVVGRSLTQGLDFKFVNSMRFAFGLLFLLVYVSLIGGWQLEAMTPLFWRNTFIIAMLTGFFALLLYYYGLKNTKASVATLMELGYPLALTAVNWIFLDIKLDSWQITGAVILLISVTVIVLYGSSENRELDQPNNQSINL
jgi:drug/metabolite transporter (DMT)-like permease